MSSFADTELYGESSELMAHPIWTRVREALKRLLCQPIPLSIPCPKRIQTASMCFRNNWLIT
jgi:hypothetical protein